MSCKRIPDNAQQHKTAGPYSPVLEVEFNKLVLISGQAPIDIEGKVVGDNIEDQTRFTMENCIKQLKTANCTLDDVFKVNVYLSDLNLWPRFNEVYKTYFKEPLPVRTAVQTGLLYTFLVEIEMWAAKK
ncbi:RidA family protein [Brachyspira pilosicoli]|uniref:RidA family protein n=1 Tax=Brachyspira pilosicoli TaxID=52584 RepID=UPI0025D836F5|nr:RidA family protein [uncultured Brachyspira sp.]